MRWQYASGLLIAWAGLTAVNLHWLIDDWYKYSFSISASQDFFARFFTIDYNKDPAYFLLQATLAGLLSFEIFFSLLIFLCLAIKFLALLQVNPIPRILDVAPYFLVLGFLHEGIQMRIAIALSIALWAIVYFSRNQRFLSYSMLVFASTFHISTSTFFFVFLLKYLYSRFGSAVLIAGVSISAILSYTTFVQDLLIQVGVATNARFLLYSQGTVYENQNSTGLFPYFVFFVTFCTAFVWYFYRPVTEVWKNLYRLALSSGLLAIAILQVFSFNVVVSSRLADLLLLPILLVLGATLTQLKNEKRYWPLVLALCVLISYFMARALASFNPELVRAILV
jgi:hypothetical protein